MQQTQRNAFNNSSNTNKQPHRTTGLLRSGAIKLEDKPLWYDIYAAFPPPLEPRYDRPAPNINVKQIFYEEDVIRAYVYITAVDKLFGLKQKKNVQLSPHRKYHKLMRNVGSVNLLDRDHKTQTQLFIDEYKQLKSQGALDEDKIIEVAQDIVRDKLRERFESQKETIGLVSSFTEATKVQPAPKPENPTAKTPTIDLKNIFD